MLISLAISYVSLTSWSESMEDVIIKTFHFILLQFQFLYIHIIMFFILGVKNNWENEHIHFRNVNHFWVETGAFHKFWTMDSPVCVNLYLNSRVFWDFVWSGGTSLHLVDSEAVRLLTNSHVLRDLAGEDLLSSDGRHHVLLKSGVRLHRAGLYQEKTESLNKTRFWEQTNLITVRK